MHAHTYYLYIVIYIHAGKLVDMAVSPRTPLCTLDNDTPSSGQMNPISRMLSLLNSAYDFSDTCPTGPGLLCSVESANLCIVDQLCIMVKYSVS